MYNNETSSPYSVWECCCANRLIYQFSWVKRFNEGNLLEKITINVQYFLLSIQWIYFQSYFASQSNFYFMTKFCAFSYIFAGAYVIYLQCRRTQYSTSGLAGVKYSLMVPESVVEIFASLLRSVPHKYANLWAYWHTNQQTGQTDFLYF